MHSDRFWLQKQVRELLDSPLDNMIPMPGDLAEQAGISDDAMRAIQSQIDVLHRMIEEQTNHNAECVIVDLETWPFSNISQI